MKQKKQRAPGKDKKTTWNTVSGTVEAISLALSQIILLCI